MILIADIGNSEIDFGLYDGQIILRHFSKSTSLSETPDEIGVFVLQMLKRYRILTSKIEGIAICSVVPEMNRIIKRVSLDLFEKEPFFVNSEVSHHVKFAVDNPGEVGSDRLANVTAAFVKYGGPIIAIDFGTATTFSVVNKKGHFLGGAILAGMQTMKNALVSKTSKLPAFDLVKPEKVIGRNTLEAMKSGTINGYMGAIQHLTAAIKSELGEKKIIVLATGGVSTFLEPLCPWIDKVEPHLTLEGTGILYYLNA
ncbi:MAG: type III pantothenate kinase [Candidatus Riflebacteria bacterium]|nr:type III pantothenate kinase [Candidatus Riflebacteria bacterium]